MGGADQWGNITAGLELIRRTSGAGRGRASRPTAWPTSCCSSPSGDEVRQERGRRLGLARPGADDAVRVLPVLAQRRRPRRRHVPALVHRVRRASEIEALEAEVAARPEARAAQRRWPVDLTARTHGDGGGRRRPSPIREALFSARADRRPGASSRALYGVARRVRRSTPATLAAGAAVLPGRGRPVRLARRGAPDDRRRRRDDQRRRGSTDPRRPCPSRSPGSGSTSGSASGRDRSAIGRQAQACVGRPRQRAVARRGARR